MTNNDSTSCIARAANTTVWLAAFLAGACVVWGWLPAGAQLDVCPDSVEYLQIARNLHNGNGYRTLSDVFAIHRSPAYPLLLSLIYDENTESWNKRILFLHRILAFLAGALLLLLANRLFDRVGMYFSLLACFLVSHDRELQYSAVEILTELPATTFLLLALLSSSWALEGRPEREFISALAHSLLFMTRSALIFVSVAYGIFHVASAMRQRDRHALLRVLYFGGPCTLTIALWSVFLWSSTGQIILLTSTGPSNLAAGMAPGFVAQLKDLPVPHTDIELEKFWTAAPGLTTDEASAAIRHSASTPMTTLTLLIPKFKIAFQRIPPGCYFLGVFGMAVQILFTAQWLPTDGRNSRETRGNLRHTVAAVFFMGALSICILGACGYSHPIAKASMVICTAAVILLRVHPANRELRMGPVHKGVFAVCAATATGFILMTLFAFGLPRFTRPFLPELYLSAVLCAPLASMMLMRHSPR